MNFSRRTSWELHAQTDVTGALDLTETNPCSCGLGWSEEELRPLLAPEGSASYRPEPRGLLAAREAIARWSGAGDPEHLLLTSGTSEAYAFLLKLLCDPGDRILVFTPGYPLLEQLADLECVSLVKVPLIAAADWAIPLEAVAKAIEGVKAVAVVSPANPTGQRLRDSELEALDALCARHGAALIVDEVFAPQRQSIIGRCTSALTFALSGLSKAAALPQLKLAWLWAGGPEQLRDAALSRLEIIADAFLSVATPVQLAVGELLARAPAIQARIRARIEENLGVLQRSRDADAAWTVLPSEGGWSAVLRIPREPGEDAVVARALEAGVLVRPGSLFDLPAAHLVLSLLPEPATFAEGVRRLCLAL